ncbi:hypothetical protein FRC00_012970 [Tulasnella sp. 408]|nr:hypothetical protein FRC00_012970 [Tulasnella sp. 408]
MAWIDPLPEDTAGPPAYNDDVQLKPSPTYASTGSQTDPAICPCGQSSLTINLSADREPVACSACLNDPAVAAVTLRCGHAICSFHLSFFTDGFRSWQAQQAVPTGSTLAGQGLPSHSGPVESLEALSLSTTIEPDGANGASEGTPASALSELSSTSGGTPFINPDLEPVASFSFMQQLASPPPSVSPYPDPTTPTSNVHLGEEQAQSTSSPLASPVTLNTPAHNPMPPSSFPGSDLSSSSSESSEGSYGSWTSSVAAEANDLMAVYEAREFGSNVNQQAGEENQPGAGEVVYWPADVYNDVEMHDAEADTN